MAEPQVANVSSIDAGRFPRTRQSRDPIAVANCRKMDSKLPNQQNGGTVEGADTQPLGLVSEGVRHFYRKAPQRSEQYA